MSDISMGLVEALCKEVLKARGFRPDTFHSYEILESIDGEVSYVPERIVIYIEVYNGKIPAVVLMNPDDELEGTEGISYKVIHIDQYNYYYEKLI